MRIGQRAQLVLVMFRRLMIARLPDLDGEQIIGNVALVHDDIGVNRFSEVIVGRDDRSLRQPQRSLPQPVVIAIDFPSRKLLFDIHCQPVRQRALSEVLLKQVGLACVEFLQRIHNLVQLGLHAASVKNILSRRVRGGLTVAPALTSELRSASVPARQCLPPAPC